VPELFTAPALQKLQDRRREEADFVPYFYGLTAGEGGALVASFAGEPEVHDPVRGRVKGVTGFEAFVEETNAWLARHAATVDHRGHVILERRGFEEDVLHLDGEAGPVDLHAAVVADHAPDARLEELRVYCSRWPLTGRHASRPPLLQRDPDLRVPAVVAEYQEAVAAGDVAAVVATFDADGSVQDSEGVHRGADGLRAYYDRVLSPGGIRSESCTAVDDGQTCALEYNIVGWGDAELPPQAAVAVFVRGESGRLTTARLYDDLDPRLAVLA
jgi:hypothetical protein